VHVTIELEPLKLNIYIIKMSAALTGWYKHDRLMTAYNLVPLAKKETLLQAVIETLKLEDAVQRK
jgi:hypothetical protein